MRRHRFWETIGLLPIIAVVAACDPCFSAIGCSTTPLMSIDGQIVRAEDGRGVGGVRVDVIRTAGVAWASDSVSTATDAEGHWHIAIGATGSGSTTADIVVTSTLASYRVGDVALHASTVAGESTLLDRWVVYPYFPISAELHWRGTNGEEVTNASVDFQRTSGVQLFGPGVVGGAIHTATDASGRAAFYSFSSGIFSASLGDLIGDLTVSSPSITPTTTHNVQLGAQYHYHPPTEIAVLGVGPAIDWVFEIFNRATGQPQPGVQVRFTRTGGIDATPSTFTAVSGSDGHVQVPVRALSDGTLIGDLELTPPAPGGVVTLSGFQFPTFDSDVASFLGVVGVMPYMPYFFGVKIGDTGVSDVDVEFRRTGGIPLQNDVVTARSSLGAFGLHPIPLAQGAVIGDLTIHAPAPYPSFVVHNLTLATVDSVGIVPDRLVYVWALDLPPSGPAGTTVELLPQTQLKSLIPK